METFVEKVCFGSGPHFNSILEERGRWISGEARRHDMEMVDSITNFLADASQAMSEDALNPLGHKVVKSF